MDGAGSAVADHAQAVSGGGKGVQQGKGVGIGRPAAKGIPVVFVIDDPEPVKQLGGLSGIPVLGQVPGGVEQVGIIGGRAVSPGINAGGGKDGKDFPDRLIQTPLKIHQGSFKIKEDKVKRPVVHHGRV